MAQPALYQPETVDLPQVFLVFATDAKGQTLYERAAVWNRSSTRRDPNLIYP